MEINKLAKELGIKINWSNSFDAIQETLCKLHSESLKNPEKQYILCMDEIVSSAGETIGISDWSKLKTDYCNIDFLLALNPMGTGFNATMFKVTYLFRPWSRFFLQWENIYSKLVGN